MKVINVMTAQTGADTSEEFHCDGRNPVTVICDGLLTTETAKLQIKQSDGTYVTVKTTDGDEQCDLDNNTMPIYGAGIYVVYKSATSASVGVDITSHGY